jgi:hypothetical protein
MRPLLLKALQVRIMRIVSRHTVKGRLSILEVTG